MISPFAVPPATTSRKLPSSMFALELGAARQHELRARAEQLRAADAATARHDEHRRRTGRSGQLRRERRAAGSDDFAAARADLIEAGRSAGRHQLLAARHDHGAACGCAEHVQHFAATDHIAGHAAARRQKHRQRADKDRTGIGPKGVLECGEKEASRDLHVTAHGQASAADRAVALTAKDRSGKLSFVSRGRVAVGSRRLGPDRVAERALEWQRGPGMGLAGAA